MSQYWWVAETTGGEVIGGYDEEKVCATSEMLVGKRVKKLSVLSVFDESFVEEIDIPDLADPYIGFRRCLCMEIGGTSYEGQEVQLFGYEFPGGGKHVKEFYPRGIKV